MDLRVSFLSCLSILTQYGSLSVQILVSPIRVIGFNQKERSRGVTFCHQRCVFQALKPHGMKIKLVPFLVLFGHISLARYIHLLEAMLHQIWTVASFLKE